MSFGVGLALAIALAVSASTVEPPAASPDAYVTAADPFVVTVSPSPAFPVNRHVAVSRSFSRGIVPFKQSILAVRTGGQEAKVANLTGTDPRTIAKAMLLEFGFSSSQFSCLNTLWDRESHWRVNAQNHTSGAYGIPQALPGSKMATAGLDWKTNAATQIRWGLGYIKQRYGSPCGALDHSNSVGWY